MSNTTTSFLSRFQKTIQILQVPPSPYTCSIVAARYVLSVAATTLYTFYYEHSLFQFWTVLLEEENKN
jgi:hypothetical protein